MILLRRIFNLIAKHKILSLTLLLVVATITMISTILIKRSSGTLSPPLELSTIVQSIYGIGTVTASQSYQLKFGVVSSIEELYVKEGDVVLKGEKLMKIESNIYRAPFKGTITSLPFKVGENVFTNLPILTLVNLLDRYLVVTLEQQGALRVLKGQKVIISFDSIRDKNYAGEVESVYSSNSNFLARINVSNLPERILPDMTADVAITLHEKKDAIVIPIKGLDHGKVWIKRGRGLVKQSKVKIGIVDRAFAEVVSGDIKVGDRVLIK